jgi:hypothetical protein
MSTDMMQVASPILSFNTLENFIITEQRLNPSSPSAFQMLEHHVMPLRRQHANVVRRVVRLVTIAVMRPHQSRVHARALPVPSGGECERPCRHTTLEDRDCPSTSRQNSTSRTAKNHSQWVNIFESSVLKCLDLNGSNQHVFWSLPVI